VQMGKHYRHLSVRQRERLAKMYHEGHSLAEMAKALRRNKSTISRELGRNGSPKLCLYSPCRAQVRSDERRSKASRRPRINDERIRSYIRQKLTLGWSPEIIAGRLPLEHPRLQISHETIYQYLYDRRTKNRKELVELLRRAHRRRKLKGIGRKVRKTKIPNRIPIEARPKAVDSRRYYGHWEGDTMESQKSPPVLNSLTERKSRLLLLTKLERKAAGETKRAIVGRLVVLPSALRKTITLDNGTENTLHEEITMEIGAKCYFARPYASWQRGSNEQTNGMVRWYLPKGTDFRNITEEEIAAVESRINNRPRKCLKFKTPLEVFTRVVALRS
jgi:transposase, IS30 family